MTSFRKKIEKLRKTNPLFKDFEYKTHYNDLTGLVEYIEELRKKKLEELNESNNNTEKLSE